MNLNEECKRCKAWHTNNEADVLVKLCPCTCHTTQTEHEYQDMNCKGCHLCTQTEKTIDNTSGAQVISVPSCVPVDQTEEGGWEEKFDRLFLLKGRAKNRPLNQQGPLNIKEFIRKVEAEAEARGREELDKEVKRLVHLLGTTRVELYKGKLPFVVFDSDDDGKAVAIYRQALKDLSAQLFNPRS